jgi:arylsulfatase A-like enzyme
MLRKGSGLGITPAGNIFSRRVRGTVSRFVDRVFFGEPRIGRVELCLAASCFAILTGLLEAGLERLAFLISGDPRIAAHPDNLWLAPVGVTVIALVAATALILAVWRWRAQFSLKSVTFLGTAIAVYTVLATPRLGLHPASMLLLSAGIGAAAARVIGRNPGPFTHRLRYATAAFMLVVLVIAGTRMSVRTFEDGTSSLAGSPPEGAKNLLLLILDTVRSKSLSLYGYERETTPELDRRAATGIVFDHAFSVAPWTLPSHASLFTGEWPHNLSADFGQPLDDTQATLGEVLRDKGYATGGFVANLTFASRYTGLARGFTTFVDFPLDSDALLISSRWTRLVARNVRRVLGDHRRFGLKSAATVNREFSDWVSGLDGRPFFAFLNYFDAHEPYQAPPEFARRFSDKPPRYWRYSTARRDYSREELQEFQNAYDSGIAYIDSQIGALLDDLDRRGILRNTVVIVTSDHGELFGEHELIGHSNSLYLPLLHVPLVILGAVDTRGLRLAEPVSLRNLASTALDLIGVPGQFPGTSFAQIWESDSEGKQDELILSELTHNESTAANGPVRDGDMKSAVHQSYHYIVGGAGREELYNYIRDPDEKHNLVRDPKLRRILSRFRLQLLPIHGEQ